MYHGKITKARKKRKYATGREAVETTIGNDRKKKIKTKGGGDKLKLISTKYANIILENRGVKCEILGLIESPAGRDYTRRNIITRGAILKMKTPQDKEVKAKVTSRPGQDGILNAVLL